MIEAPTPSAPSSIACFTSACMPLSCSGVGLTSSSPSSWMRTVVAPMKDATLGVMPFFCRPSRYSPSVVQSIGYLMSPCCLTSSSFIFGVYGPMDQPSPMISSVTPCLVSLKPRPSAISDSVAQLSTLMNPGDTAWPFASSICFAVAAAPFGSSAAMRPSFTATSTSCAAPPLPSYTTPLRISKSYWAGACSCAAEVQPASASASRERVVFFMAISRAISGVAANGAIEHQQQHRGDDRQRRQQQEEGGVAHVRPQRADQSREQTATEHGQVPRGHRGRAQARRRELGEQAQAGRQDVQLAEGEDQQEQRQPGPAHARAAGEGIDDRQQYVGAGHHQRP